MAPDTATTVTSGGLTLVEGQLYYVCVRGTDVAGNANLAHGTDGAVRFISDNINALTFFQLAGKADGAVVGEF